MDDQRQKKSDQALFFSCGSNVDGRLGIAGKSEECHSLPCPLNTLAEKTAIALSSGRAHTLTILSDEGSNGEIYGWGSNSKGQLGVEETALFKPALISIENILADLQRSDEIQSQDRRKGEVICMEDKCMHYCESSNIIHLPHSPWNFRKM